MGAIQGRNGVLAPELHYLASQIYPQIYLMGIFMYLPSLDGNIADRILLT